MSSNVSCSSILIEQDCEIKLVPSLPCPPPAVLWDLHSRLALIRSCRIRERLEDPNLISKSPWRETGRLEGGKIR